MKKHSFLPLLLVCFFLISLLLPSCVGSYNLPIQGESNLAAARSIGQEEGQQGDMGRTEIEENQQQIGILQTINVLDIFPAEIWQDVYSYLNFIETEYEQYQSLIEQQEIDVAGVLPVEIWQSIFSHLDCENILAARLVHPVWNMLITGHRQASIVGVGNKPIHIIDTRAWTRKKEIDFRYGPISKVTPATIPSFSFYLLMGKVENLPQAFWPYLQGTNVHTLGLSNNEIKNTYMLELAKVLPQTQIHTLDLCDNNIDDKGIIELAKVLPQTHIHTLDLSNNSIKDAGMIELAKVLSQTQIHTLFLDCNEIGYEGVVELAKVLPQTHIHILDLSANEIGDETLTELAKVLPQTHIHTLDLSGNQIGAETKVLLKELHPNINIKVC